MNEQLISFECAKLAKEKGFDWECNGFYFDQHEASGNLNPYGPMKNRNYTPIFCSAPPQSLLQKWLRDEKKIHVEADYYTFENWAYNIWLPKEQVNGYVDPEFKTYESALEAGLIEALKLLEND